MVLKLCIFQSTLPHGSDAFASFMCFVKRISIHAPSRERLFIAQSNNISSVFQSTLPHGSDLVNPQNQNNGYMRFQSTLPHGSDNFSTANKVLSSMISIHAPSRERQTTTKILGGNNHISIHAPSRERLLKMLNYFGDMYFNPRSLTGATATSSPAFSK